ncbi:MFS transporter [Chloroflexota bacterium]
MFYGWWILTLGFLGSAFYGATIFYGFTAYFNPLVEEFGWSYTAISLVASFRGLESGLMEFPVGLLLDRFGSRRIVFVCCILIGLSFIALSIINSLVQFYLIFILIFLGGSGLGPVFITYIISQWFRKRFGLAFGIAMVGYGAGGFAVPMIVYLLDSVGLRNTFIIFGVAACILSIIMVGLLRNKPEDIGCNPDGLPEEEIQGTATDIYTGISAANASNRDYSLRETLSDRSFWILIYVGAAILFSVFMVVTHVMPYLEDMGYIRGMAGIIAMMIPVVSIVGRLGFGWVSDLTSSKTILIAGVILQAVGVLLFLNAQLPFILVPFVILFGIAYGGNLVIRLRILRDYYGKGKIASISGFYVSSTLVLSFFSPLLAGFIFDRSGSYSIAWIVNIALLIIGLLLLLFIRNPQTNLNMCNLD